MIYGIYVKSRPKSKWHLVALPESPEMATQEANELQKQAALKGDDGIQVGIQIFESVFWIPEYMDELKERKPLFN